MFATVTAAGRHRPGATDAIARPRFEAAAIVFRNSCVRCHGATETSGGLRLDSYEAVMRGGDRGPAIVPRDPAASLLLQKILRRDRPAMPPRKTLAVPEVAAIRAWIAAGALP